MFNIITWYISALGAFYVAYMIKNDEKYRTPNYKRLTIKDNGEVVTFFRNYNSEPGYLKYSYIAWLEWGTYSFLKAILSSVFKQVTGTESIFLLIGLLLANHIAYSKCKTI